LILPPDVRLGVSDTKPPATKVEGVEVIEAVYPQVCTGEGCVKDIE